MLLTYVVVAPFFVSLASAGRPEALQKARGKDSATADDQLSTGGSIPLCTSALMCLKTGLITS